MAEASSRTAGRTVIMACESVRRSRYAAKSARKPGLKVEHADPCRVQVDAGHPGARLVNLGKICPGRFLTEVAAGRRRILGRDAIGLGDLDSPADREHLGREGLGIDRDGGTGVRP